jgi:diguanylate cyclase (GGDEF)-like protein
MHPQEKPVILIVDDSRVVRVSLKNILQNDCQLIEAEDGQKAWELLLETPHIQLMFSDLSMPNLDGRGLLRKIRNSEINRIRNVPFIVVTGNEQEGGMRDELLDMGATEVVNKPFDPASIVSIVSTLVSRQENESYMLLPEADAQTEQLPDVLNQDAFMQNASKELSFAIRNKNELAISLLRIDQFEQLEHHYSDAAIEHILMATADVIRQHIHPDDTMAYFGHGLFAMLRPASNAIGTRYIGRRIVDDIAAKQFYLGESEDIISVSMGISAPQIKPGIRLRELLLLAEGRLKAAMDLGGNRVIDKGNDTLTPIALSDSAPGLMAETQSSSNLHSEVGKSSLLEADSIPDRPQRRNAIDTQKLEEKVQQLQSRLESLSHENKELQGQLERWRKQSGESEQLRQRVFELESEQQQMQLKLTELAANNSTLQKRSEEAESERQKLLNGEDEKHLTLKQANQFYEQENTRLEGQLEAVSGRAQKAELAYRKSEQLVVSLKDNIKLLRAQLEQAKKQLLNAQQQATQPTARAAEPKPQSEAVDVDINVDVDTDPILDEDTHIEMRADSSLVIDGFPSSKPLTADIDSASVVQLFAEPSQATPAPAPAAQKTPPRKVEEPPKAKAQEKNPFESIPVYRAQPQEEKFKAPRRPLSSFAIASLILVGLISLGGGYFYYYWQNEGTVSDGKGSAETTVAKPRKKETPPQAPLSSKLAATQPDTVSKPRAAAPVVDKPAVNPAAQTDEEARLQAELTLRQIAEEEFRQRLQDVSLEASPSTSLQAADKETLTTMDETVTRAVAPEQPPATPAAEHTEAVEDSPAAGEIPSPIPQ